MSPESQHNGIRLSHMPVSLMTDSDQLLKVFTKGLTSALVEADDRLTTRCCAV